MTEKYENIAVLASYENHTELLLKIISKTRQNKFLLRRNNENLNFIGSLLRSEIQLESLEKVLKRLIQRGVVSSNVLIVIVYHQWWTCCARNSEYQVRSLEQVTDIMQKFKLFDRLTLDRGVADLHFGLEIRKRKRQSEILATLLHQAMQTMMDRSSSDYSELQLGCQNLGFK